MICIAAVVTVWIVSSCVFIGMKYRMISQGDVFYRDVGAADGHVTLLTTLRALTTPLMTQHSQTLVRLSKAGAEVRW